MRSGEERLIDAADRLASFVRVMLDSPPKGCDLGHLTWTAQNILHNYDRERRSGD